MRLIQSPYHRRVKSEENVKSNPLLTDTNSYDKKSYNTTYSHTVIQPPYHIKVESEENIQSNPLLTDTNSYDQKSYNITHIQSPYHRRVKSEETLTVMIRNLIISPTYSHHVIGGLNLKKTSKVTLFLLTLTVMIRNLTISPTYEVNTVTIS